MPAAPQLRIIEGGLGNDTPRVQVPTDADRLVLPPAPVRAWFLPVLLAALAVHAGIIAGLMNLSLFGEPEGAGGTVAIDEIEVELVDATPPAAAAAIATYDAVSPVNEDTAIAPAASAATPSLADDWTATPPADDAAEAAMDGGLDRPVEAGEVVPVPVTNDYRARQTTETVAAALAADDALPREDAAIPAAPVADDAAEAVGEDTGIRPVEVASPADTTPANPAKTAGKMKAAAAVKAPPAPAAKAAPNASGKPAAPAKSAAKAGAARAGGPNKALLSSYYARLSAHLRGYRSYPSQAASRRLSGRAVVSVTINASGRVLGVKIRSGTGHAVLDKEALAMARRASPFPAIPKDLGKASLTFDAPVRFDPR